MPILELKSFEKIPKKKPFKFLSGVFRRGASQELEITEDMLYGTDRELSPRPLTPAGHLDIEEEMENLHLSRRDNPYLSSCEALDDCEEGSLSPGPGSPRQSSLSPPVSSEAVSPPSYQTIVELHSHLVRSPPPVHWPVKVEEGADFGSCRELSPGSGGGSVERLAGLSPFSPVRGQTPAVSPARGQTPEHTVSSPSQEGERPVVGGVGLTSELSDRPGQTTLRWSLAHPNAWHSRWTGGLSLWPTPTITGQPQTREGTRED